MKASWILAGVVAVVIVSTPFALSLAYRQVDQVATGSLAYWLGIPDVAKAVPQIMTCQSARFSMRAAKGDQPPLAQITYGTQSPGDHPAAVVAGYFATLGCTANAAESPFALTCPNGSTVSIALTDAAACRIADIQITDPTR